MTRLDMAPANRRPMHSRPNPQLAQYMAGQLGARAVIIFDFGPPKKPGGPATVRASCWGATPAILHELQELGMEIIEDLDKGFTDSGDLARAITE